MNPNKAKENIGAIVILLVITAALLSGCGRRKNLRDEWVVLPQVTDPNDIVVACPDDGIHAVVDGKCMTPAEANATEPCPSDDRHQRVNGVCVDILGK